MKIFCLVKKTQILGKKTHLVFGEKDTEISINVGPSVIKASKEEKLLGVVIDQKLNSNNI